MKGIVIRPAITLILGVLLLVFLTGVVMVPVKGLVDGVLQAICGFTGGESFFFVKCPKLGEEEGISSVKLMQAALCSYYRCAGGEWEGYSLDGCDFVSREEVEDELFDDLDDFTVRYYCCLMPSPSRYEWINNDECVKWETVEKGEIQSPDTCIDDAVHCNPFCIADRGFTEVSLVNRDRDEGYCECSVKCPCEYIDVEFRDNFDNSDNKVCDDSSGEVDIESEQYPVEVKTSSEVTLSVSDLLFDRIYVGDQCRDPDEGIFESFIWLADFSSTTCGIGYHESCSIKEDDYYIWTVEFSGSNRKPTTICNENKYILLNNKNSFQVSDIPLDTKKYRIAVYDDGILIEDSYIDLKFKNDEAKFRMSCDTQVEITVPKSTGTRVCNKYHIGYTSDKKFDIRYEPGITPTVTTDKDSYARGEIATFTAEITGAVFDITIEFVITDPIRVEVDTCTIPLGDTSCSVTWTVGGLEDTYTLFAVARQDGTNVGRSSTTFVVAGGEPCTTDNDNDGYGVGTGCLGPDCDDGNLDVNPGETELCFDSIDNDCDDNAGNFDNDPTTGVDCDDADCSTSPFCPSGEYILHIRECDSDCKNEGTPDDICGDWDAVGVDCEDVWIDDVDCGGDCDNFESRFFNNRIDWCNTDGDQDLTVTCVESSEDDHKIWVVECINQCENRGSAEDICGSWYPVAVDCETVEAGVSNDVERKDFSDPIDWCADDGGHDMTVTCVRSEPELDYRVYVVDYDDNTRRMSPNEICDDPQQWPGSKATFVDCEKIPREDLPAGDQVKDFDDLVILWCKNDSGGDFTVTCAK